MKVGIITVFDAVNYGSFLQAYCLQRALKELGCNDITMIKDSSVLYEKWRITSLYTYNPKKMKFKNALRKNYRSAWGNFKISRNKKGYDLVIVGSDEMWEVNNITMKPRPAFWGIGVDTKKLIGYAISSNSTKLCDTKKYLFIKEGLKKFQSISVRDKSTYEAYAPQVKIKVKYCIDPTLLVNLKSIADSGIQIKDYILCYTYTFKPYMITAVKEIAKVYNKKIVVVGQNFEWADICVPASPFQFLGLLNSADFVVTDTFHGTVLSIGLKKEFVTFAYKEKVYRLVEQFDLLSRNAEGKTSLLSYYQKKINYSRVDNILGKLRESSLEYLKESIKV